MALLLACGTPSKPETPPSAADASVTPTAQASAAPASTGTIAETPTSTAAHATPPTPAGSAAASDGDADPQAALARAKKESKPAFVVFCAKWVAACGELAHSLVEPGVKKTLDEKFVVARVDVSNEDDAATKERMKKYNVKGLPVMILFDRKGKEIARESGYLDAGRIAKLLERAK